MLTIDLSYAATGSTKGRPPAPVVEAPENHHDIFRYAKALESLSGHELMQREMDVYMAYVLSMDRRFDRSKEETEALKRAQALIEDERAKRDPKFGAFLEEKRAISQIKRR